MRAKIRLWLPLAISGLALFGATAVHAAKPAVQGCVGESISSNAQNPAYFSFAPDAAKAYRGLGSLIQAGQAGDVPDEVYWNTCND